MSASTNTVLPLKDLRNSFDDDPDIIKSILDMFLEEVPMDYMQLRQYVESGNFEAAGLLAHKIKSSYRTLEIQHMAVLLQEIEVRAKNNEETEKIPKLMADLDQKYDAVQLKVIKTKESL